MKRAAGFTLIELVVFIIVTGILLSTIMLGAVTAMRNTPVIHQQWIAVQTARGCMEWFFDQIELNGYTALSCPSTSNACIAPSGFSVSTSVSCTTWNSDANYKTITVNVSGLANASLAVQVGNS